MKTVGEEYFKNEKKEALEWDLNPVKSTILSLLETELTEKNYRHLTREEVIKLTKEAFKRKGLCNEGKESRPAARVMKALDKAKSRDDVILVLGDYLSNG